MHAIDIKKYDFLDFGASKAESLEYAKKHFGGKRGLGIDLDPKRVEHMNKSGYDCMVGDLTDLHLPADCVRFVKMSHILEHMPDLAGVEKAIAAGQKVATDFLIITGPFFDEDKYLRANGLKLHWSDYPEHTCHLTVQQLIKILEKLHLKTYELYLRYPIEGSSNEHIHPLASPAGSHRYDSKVHPKKKQLKFDRNVWTDFVCYVRLRPNVNNWTDVTRGYAHQIPYVLVENGNKTTLGPEMAKKFIELDQYAQAQEQKVRELKKQNKTSSQTSAEARQELHAIKNSRAWKLAQRMQRASFVASGKALKHRQGASHG